MINPVIRARTRERVGVKLTRGVGIIARRHRRSCDGNPRGAASAAAEASRKLIGYVDINKGDSRLGRRVASSTRAIRSVRSQQFAACSEPSNTSRTETVRVGAMPTLRLLKGAITYRELPLQHYE